MYKDFRFGMASGRQGTGAPAVAAHTSDAWASGDGICLGKCRKHGIPAVNSTSIDIFQFYNHRCVYS